MPRLGRSQESAAFIYLREKKIFEPTTLHWLRQASSKPAKADTGGGPSAEQRGVKVGLIQ